MTRADRFWRYFYSNSNLAGLGAAIATAVPSLGLLAYTSMAGLDGTIIQAWWWAFIAAGYAAGALAFAGNREEKLKLDNKLTADEIRAELNGLVRKIQRRVSPQILERVKSIKESIFVILPLITDVNSSDHNIYVIRRTALEYLPTALENYLRLPTAYAKYHIVRDNKTPEQILLDQLEILDKEMKEIVIDFSRNDTQKLLAHGRFLESKFSESDLLSMTG